MGILKHGDNREGKRSQLYTTWANMKQRCKRVKATGRDGSNYLKITYTNEWENFSSFKEWSINNGYKEGLSLDRIDVHKPYQPDNCRWVEWKVQSRNKTNTKWITWNGKTQSMADWADEIGFEVDTLKSRLLRGWSVERAFTEPLGTGRKNALNTRKRDEMGRLT